MSVSVIHAGGMVSREQGEELARMEQTIMTAIAEAKDKGVPQGLIVAIMQAHALIQTNRMIEA